MKYLQYVHIQIIFFIVNIILLCNIFNIFFTFVFFTEATYFISF